MYRQEYEALREEMRDEWVSAVYEETLEYGVDRAMGYIESLLDYIAKLEDTIIQIRSLVPGVVPTVKRDEFHLDE